MTSLPPSTSLTSTQLYRLQSALERANKSFNPVECLLSAPFSSPGYHTTLKGGAVHPIRESFCYAVALLDSGDKTNEKRGCAILNRLLDLQDTDPESKTYGIWSWFVEESLQQMSPPDWNWADFCGSQLLETALTHSFVHPYDLQERIKNGIIHAARSIERRNMGPHYTNIAIMGTFVTLAAAELYEIPDLYVYAMARLRRFHAYTIKQDGFTEYNSPTYTIVALDELSRLTRHIRDPEARTLAGDLYRRAWKEFADYFHAPTRQWSGPQSRAYRTLLPDSVYGLLHRATGGRFPCGDVEPEITEHRLLHTCPSDLEERFLSLDQPTEHRRIFIRGKEDRPDTIGTTYQAPAFSLGTISAGDMWNQRRTLLAYWGTAAKPSSLHVRFLRDGYDFSGAHLLSVQRAGDVLAGIAFAVDGYGTHIFFDPIKDGTIRARDLRLRFEFEGGVALRIPPGPSHLSEPWILQDENTSLSIVMTSAAWGSSEAYWEQGSADGKSWIDVVLYAGEEQEFRLAEIPEAACTFGLRLVAGAAKALVPTVSRAKGFLSVTAEDMKLSFPAAPVSQAQLLRSFTASTRQA